MTSVFSWQNSISLCLASFRTPRPNLPVTPGVSWLPTFAFHKYSIYRQFQANDVEGRVEKRCNHRQPTNGPDNPDIMWAFIKTPGSL